MADHRILIFLGGLLLAGLAMDTLARITRLPRVTLLVLFGIAIGPAGLALVPQELNENYPLLATLALVMVAFLLGGRMTRKLVAESGRQIMAVSIVAVLVTAAMVWAGLYAIGTDPLLCLVLAGVSAATAPAATADVVARSGMDTPFTRTLLGIVAIDDAWALILFSLLLAAGLAMNGLDGTEVLQFSAYEVFGAILLGVAVGVPAAMLTGRLAEGDPSLTEALAVVFLVGGLSLYLEVSFLLAAMAAGVVVANSARHHNYAFHEIEHIEWPFMVFFFILAGATLEVHALAAVGATGAAYFVLRFAGRIAGGWLGGRLGGMAVPERNWIGMALMPQAGVAMGMALVAADAFPEQGEAILAATIGTTIAFELAGPLMTQLALSRVGCGEKSD